MRILSIILVSLLFMLNTNAQNFKAQKVSSVYFKRLYRLNDSVYRSEQPSKKGFRELKASGIKTIINLRRLKDDHKKAKNTQLHLEHLRLKSSEINEQDIITALQILLNAEKPVLIHCWHGSDRTGIITAAYRIVVENWPKEKAIEEFRQPEFGYHENWYPNLVTLLNTLDITKIKEALGI